MCIQQVLTVPFETLQTFSNGLKMCMWSSCSFFSLSFTCKLSTFCLNNIHRVGILCAQLLLQVSINLFEILLAVSTWSEDVHVV